jgi:hypothetical protein
MGDFDDGTNTTNSAYSAKHLNIIQLNLLALLNCSHMVLSACVIVTEREEVSLLKIRVTISKSTPGKEQSTQWGYCLSTKQRVDWVHTDESAHS